MLVFAHLFLDISIKSTKLYFQSWKKFPPTISLFLCKMTAEVLRKNCAKRHKDLYIEMNVTAPPTDPTEKFPTTISIPLPVPHQQAAHPTDFSKPHVIFELPRFLNENPTIIELSRVIVERCQSVKSGSQDMQRLSQSALKMPYRLLLWISLRRGTASCLLDRGE